MGDEVYGMDMLPRTAACAEYAVIDQKRIARKPRNLSHAEAAAVPLAGLTAYQALKMGRVGPATRVLIIGASGGVGTFAVQIARTLGAKVTGVCSGKNADLVKSLGADETIDYTKHDFINDHADYDLVFDVTSYQSLATCSSLLRSGGMYITAIGNLKNVREYLRDNLTKRGQRAGAVVVSSNTRDLEALTTLFEEGRIKPIIQEEFPLERIDEAFALSRTGRSVGKIVISVKGDL